MSEYNYGVNLLFLLNQLSQHETYELMDGEFEVEVEEESGVSGFATVEIPKLAEDAAKSIDGLQQKLDAAEATIRQQDELIVGYQKTIRQQTGAIEKLAVIEALVSEWANHKSALDEFDGDRRGIAEHVYESEQALLTLAAQLRAGEAK